MGNRKADAPLDPWAVSDADYPDGAAIEERIRFLLRYAILAPSGHNTQPWLFAIRGNAVELRADRTRALPVVDPDDRALVISCGAALGALRIAARRFGLPAAVERLPNRNDDDLLARVSFEQGDPPSRPRLAETIGRQGDYSQLVVRFGYGPPVKPEPRRAVEEVLLSEEQS